jgi:hypothetical protein
LGKLKASVDYWGGVENKIGITGSRFLDIIVGVIWAFLSLTRKYN